jgi:hypothetical protein
MKNKLTVAFCLALFAITTGCKKENSGNEDRAGAGKLKERKCYNF